MGSNATTAAPSDGYEYDGYGYDESYSLLYDYPEYKASNLIFKIVPPILIFLGTVGNILSVIVLQRRALRTSTTAFYLTVLAFSDLLVLYTGLLRQWIIYLFEKDVRHISEFGCKLHVFLVYFSLDMSAWILMAVTLERIISVWLPHSAKSKCTKKIAMILLSTVAAFLAALNSHVFYGMGTYILPKGVVVKCVTIDGDYAKFFNNDWTWIDLWTFCLIPFTFIVIGNTLILVKVIKSHQRTKVRVNPIVTGNGNVATANRSGSGGGGKNSAMTTILFTLNIVFLVTTLPVSVYNIGYPYWVVDASPQEFAQLDMWWAIVTMLQYTNNCLNFLLYCLSGPKFRQEFLLMIRGCCSTIAKFQQSVYERMQFQTTNSVQVSPIENTKSRLSPSTKAFNVKPANNGNDAVDVKPATNGNGDVDVKPVTNGNGDVDVKPATNGNDTVDVKPVTNGNGAIDVKPATNGNDTVDVKPATNGNGAIDVKPATNGNDTVDVKPATNGNGDVDVKPATNGNGDVDVNPANNGNGAVDVKPTTNGNGAIDVKPATNGNSAVDVKPATNGNATIDVKPANNTNGVVQGIPPENGSCQGQITIVTADMGRGDMPSRISLHSNIALHAQSTGIDSASVSRAYSSHI